jgi:ribosome-binding protein aMBF1 (putative translation factor)
MAPYADPEKRREYDKERKQKQRSQGWTKKGVDNRLTVLEIKTAKDLCGIINEVVDEARNADGASLELAAKLRIKLRAVEIGLRVIEITNHEQRIAALEEKSQ